MIQVAWKKKLYMLTISNIHVMRIFFKISSMCRNYNLSIENPNNSKDKSSRKD